MAKKTDAKKPKDIKREAVANLGQKIDSAKTITFINYHGLTVNQISQMREKIKDAGGEMLVFKNTLVKRALMAHDFPISDTADEAGEPLTGPTAVVFAYEDDIAPVKVIADTAKIFTVPQFKFGFLGKTALNAQSLDQLSKLPTKPELHAKVVSTISSPLYGIVSVLSANLRNLVSVLDQASKKATPQRG